VSTLGPLLMEGRRPLARIAAFSLLPGLSLVSVVVVLPVLSARFGQAGWSSVLLGQSIGAAASVVCGLSWPLEGSNLASRTAPGQRRRRISGAVLVALGVAALAFLVLLVAGPLIVRFLFAGTIHIDRLVAFLIAAIVAGAFLARSLPLILLVPQDLARIAYRLMLLAAFLALPLLGVAAVVWGSVGALTVAAVAPWVVVAAQLTAGFRTSPRPTLLRG